MDVLKRRDKYHLEKIVLNSLIKRPNLHFILEISSRRSSADGFFTVKVQLNPSVVSLWVSRKHY